MKTAGVAFQVPLYPELVLVLFQAVAPKY